MNMKKLAARVLGNTGTYFVAPYSASGLVGNPNLEMALITALIGFILSISKESISYGQEKRNHKKV